MISIVGFLIIGGAASNLYCYSNECDDKYRYSSSFSSVLKAEGGDDVTLVEKDEVAGPDKIYEFPAYCEGGSCRGASTCDSDDLICFVVESHPEIRIVIPKDMAGRKSWEAFGYEFVRGERKLGMSPKEPVYLITWSKAGSKKDHAEVGYFIYSICSGVIEFSVARENRLDVMRLSDEKERGFGSKECIFLAE